jgi:hypothetical protein
MKKYIKYSFFSLALLVMFGLGSQAFASGNVVTYNSPTSATYTSDQYTKWGYQESGYWTAYSGCIAPNTPTTLDSSSVPMLGDNATSPIQVMGWGVACSDHSTSSADPSFDGFSYLSIPYAGGVFTDYVAPVQDNTAGIALFSTNTGAYTPTTWLGQTATALQATIGLNGLGEILALIGGLLFAFGIVLYIVAMFKEASADKKRRKI